MTARRASADSQLERIQKIIAASGRCSRREAEELISAGLVTVNGRVAELGDRADGAKDAIKVQGKLLKPQQSKRYLLLNKPRGYVTTTDDPEGRLTILELLGNKVRERVYPVGRLDIQTEGLILLTNDGALAQRVTHPSFGCAKEYEAKVSGTPPDKALARLAKGITVDGERLGAARIEPLRRTKARSGEVSANRWFKVTVHEGKNHQVRRMFDAIGHSVLKLRRVAIGPIRDELLPVGSWRELTLREVQALLRLKK